MDYEIKYKKVRNLIFILWMVRSLDYLFKKLPFYQTWLEELEQSPVGEYITSAVEPIVTNSAFQDLWSQIYDFFGMQAFVLFVALVVAKFFIGKVREVDLVLKLRKIYTCIKLTIECSSIPRIRVGKSRYIRVINKTKDTDEIIAIEAEKETQYDEILFFKRKGKVHMQKPDSSKVYLERDIWKKCNVLEEELWIKLV